MNLTNSSDFDKENINYQNVSMPVSMKKKIEKKSLCKRYKNGRTIEAIKKLTLDLKQKIISQSPQPSPQIAQITLRKGPKEQQFPCYEDKRTISEAQNLGKLLKKRTFDNDVDSDQQQLQACVEYLRMELIDAGFNSKKL